MAIVSFDTEKMNEPLFSFFDRAGVWGPSCQIEADVEVVGYEFPAVEDPPYDREDSPTVDAKTGRMRKYRGPYARFDIRCSREDENNINDRWFVEQNRALLTLTALGVHVEDDGTHDSEQVLGMKCILTTGEPTTSNKTGAKFSNIRGLQGLG